VLVVVTVDTEVLPVRSIRRVVVVIAVAVVNGEEMQSVGLELTRAFGADPTVERQGAFAIAL